MDNNAQIAIPLVITPYVTPEMFGAKGDGTTDASDAFDVMNIFPHEKRLTANYLISREIVFPDGSDIRGTADATITRNGIGYHMFTLKDNCYIEGVKFIGTAEYGNASAWDDVDLYADGASYITVKNCFFTKSAWAAQYFENASHIVIEGNAVNEYGYIGLGVGGASSDVSISNNSVKDGRWAPNRYAIALSSSRPGIGQNITVTGNYLEDLTPVWEAIDAHGGKNIVISNNIIKNFITGVMIEDKTGYQTGFINISDNVITRDIGANLDVSTFFISAYTSEEGIISGNVCIDTADNTGTADKGGFKIAGTINVIDNQIRTTATNGIRYMSLAGKLARNFIVANNRITASTNGIKLENAVGTDFSGDIHNNLFYDVPTGIVGNNNGSTNLYYNCIWCHDNIFDNVTDQYTAYNSNGTVVDFGVSNPNAYGRAGMYIKNSGYNGSNTKGWLCTVSATNATPPTWRAVN